MPEQETQLKLIKDDTLSVNDLVCLQKRGMSVLRSAHAGNLPPYNMALAVAGIPLLSVDHTITGVDRNYFPESIISQRQSLQVAPLGRLVCRVMSGQGQYLDQLHITKAKEALGAAQIFTNTEYLRANESVVREIIDLAMTEFPGVFQRIVMPDGSCVEQREAANLIGRLGIMQLNDEPRAEEEAVIIPNVLDILANFVIESLNSEQATQYHLSGPDMVRYIDQLVPELERMYARLRATASYGAALPPQLVVRLVPCAEARFATTNARRKILDSILTPLAGVAAVNERKDAFFGGGRQIESSSRKSFLEVANEQQSELVAQLCESVPNAPELFVEPKQPGFVTQYDVAAEGGLYVPEVNRSASMAELRNMSAQLQKIRKRLKL